MFLFHFIFAHSLSLACAPTADTTTMSVSGRTRQSTIGPKRWLAWGLSPKSSQIFLTIRWLAFDRLICVLVATISSRWWKSRLSSTIRPSLRRSRTLHFGLTRCTSVCLTDVTVICRVVRREVTPYGSWWWTSSIDVKIQALTKTYQDVLWWTRARAFWLVS